MDKTLIDIFKNLKMPFDNIVLNIIYIVFCYISFAIIVAPIFLLFFEIDQFIYYLPIPFLFTLNHLNTQQGLSVKGKIILTLFQTILAISILIALFNENKHQNHNINNQISNKKYTLNVSVDSRLNFDLQFLDDYKVKMTTNGAGEAIFNYTSSDNTIYIYDNAFEMTTVIYNCKEIENGFECNFVFYDVDKTFSAKMLEVE